MFHPLGSLLVGSILLLFGISAFATRSATRSPGVSLLVAVLLVIFFAWFIDFAVFRYNFSVAYQWFFYGQGKPPIETIGELWSKANLTLLDFADLLIRTYGQVLLSAFSSLLAVTMVARGAIKSRASLKLNNVFFSSVFLVLSMFYAYSLLAAFLTTKWEIRIFCWPLVASIVLNGTVFHEWLSALGSKRRKVSAILLTAMTIIAAVIGIFSVYPSPNIKQVNWQVTRADMSGMQWFFTFKTEESTVLLEQLPPRALELIYGFDAPKPSGVGGFTEVPEHLGYDTYPSLSDYFESNVYVEVSRRVRAMKTDVWPVVGRYTLAELYRLDHDAGVNRIYSNSQLEIYQVSARKR